MPADHLYVFFKKKYFQILCPFSTGLFYHYYFFIYFILFLLIWIEMFFFFIIFLTLKYSIGFAIYQHESATGIHMLFLNCVNTLFFCKLMTYLQYGLQIFSLPSCAEPF